MYVFWSEWYEGVSIVLCSPDYQSRHLNARQPNLYLHVLVMVEILNQVTWSVYSFESLEKCENHLTFSLDMEKQRKTFTCFDL